MASLTNFKVYVAPKITVNSVGFNQSNGQPAPNGLGGPSTEIENALISDQRAALPSGNSLSYYVDAGESRLVALTGMTSFSKFSEQYLENEMLYVYGSATAQPGYSDGQTAWTPQSQMAYDLKHVPFQNVEGDFVFNTLLGKNQTLLINGLDVNVVPSQ